MSRKIDKLKLIRIGKFLLVLIPLVIIYVIGNVIEKVDYAMRKTSYKIMLWFR
jgi:hypothetical protein